eukprot:PLAT7394.1.p1 GENE.PLAT7394.1~~PLAT7394.1.p1  ORF type:complete len:441 (-),score=227.83 PLAT7394.1:90-1412(-)
MADTAHSSDKEKREYFDEPDVLAAKVAQLAKWVRASRHFIAFTGAGISTAAGIPDFRSGMDTVLDTGPGVWELRAKKKKRRQKTTSSLKAVPTATHMAMVQLVKEGIMAAVVSQNTDGLHRRSGLSPDSLAELHGNTNLEVCVDCGKQYLRDFRVRNARRVHDHKTGRRCGVPGCGGALKDTIINFGENLPDRELTMAFDHAACADLCLAMGSSLRVTPAADVPEEVAQRGGRLVIVNLQSTPLDDDAALVIHAKCDDVMRALMEELELPLPEWRLRRELRLTVESVKQRRRLARKPESKLRVTVLAHDSDGTPISLFSGIRARCAGREAIAREEKESDDCSLSLLLPRSSEGKKEEETALTIDASFRGHYREPPVRLRLPVGVALDAGSTEWRLSYNVWTREWDVQRDAEGEDGGGGGAGDSGDEMAVLRDDVAALALD